MDPTVADIANWLTSAPSQHPASKHEFEKRNPLTYFLRIHCHLFCAQHDAARSLLNERITVVETLGAVLYEYYTAQQAVTQAQTRADEIAQRARETFEQARKAGWTAAELRRAGLTAPQPTRTAARKQTTHTDATDHTAPHPSADAVAQP